MAKLTPRERRHQKTKQAILKTAREIINEKGADGLSIREIAHRIDYSPAGLYEYFDSKDAIIAAVCLEGLERLNAALNRVDTALSPAERLVELGLAYLEFAQNNPEQFAFIFSMLPQAVSLPALAEIRTPYLVLQQAVRAFVTAENIILPPEFTIDELAYVLWAKVHGMAMLQQTVLSSDSVDLAATHRWAFNVFVRGLKTV